MTALEIFLNPLLRILQEAFLLFLSAEPQPPRVALSDNFRTTYLNTDAFITAIVLVVGILVGLYLVTRMRTKEKRDVEAFLSSILHTTLSGIICLKAVRVQGEIKDFSVTFVNKAILDFLNITEEAITKKSILDINPTVLYDGIFEKYKEITETGKPMKFERKVRDQFFYVLMAKLGDGVIASYYNITERKNAEERLHAKVKELEDTNLELEQFAYVTSHDLQEPLRKINMFADMMLQSCKEKETYYHLSSIMRSAGRMRKLILKLSEYSRLKHSNGLFSVVDLNDIIRDLLLIYDDLMVQTGTSLHTAHLPMVHGIPLQLYTLFDNLINNSIKFSRTNEPGKIIISAARPDPLYIRANENLNPDIQYVEIIFKDNGAGFDQGHSGKIFRIFQQLDRTEGTEDVGIGLALCLKIVRGHHGDIFAISTLNEGSEFHIILPTHQLADVA
jgi:signal transduction histidine kinase